MGMRAPVATFGYFDAIPQGLRDPLLSAFNEIVRNFREGRWEPSELNGGKLCEVIYTIIRGVADEKFAGKPSKPKNMVDACIALESATDLPRALRIQVPRLLIALYEVRNNRGVGHVGGDVDPNHMDAVLVLSMAKWLMAELVRVFHDVETREATEAVESLTEKTVPLVWRVAGRTRVLNPSLSMREKMFVVLFAANGPVSERDLIEAVEHSNAAVFRRDVLRPAHREKYVEYDKHRREVYSSPRGVAFVENNIDLEMENP